MSKSIAIEVGCNRIYLFYLKPPNMKTHFATFTSSFLLFAVLACTSGELPSQVDNVACLPFDLQNNVTAFFPFSQGSIDDFSENSYNLIGGDSIGPGEDRIGNPNCAYHFMDSTDDFLRFQDFAVADPSAPFSVSLWFKSETSDPNKFQTVIARQPLFYGCTAVVGRWNVLLVGNKIYFNTKFNSVWYELPNISEWTHIVVTSFGAITKLYVNGQLTTNPANAPCTTWGIPPAVEDLIIGEDFFGTIDDVAIFNLQLSQAQINALFNAVTCCD